MEDICKIKDVFIELYAFENSFSDETGITLNEALILCCLKDGFARSASDIAKFIGLTTSRVSRIIAAFEQKKMIVRHIGNEDKRQMFFVLTKDGKQLVSILSKKRKDMQELKQKLIDILQ